MKDIDFEKLEEELSINPDDLDTELIRHVDNFYEVSKGFKQTLENRDFYKDKLKEVDAELQFEVRDILADERTRVTEAMVEAQVILQKQHQQTVVSLREAETKLNSWSSLKDAYEQRSYALARLIELYIAGYFGISTANGAKTNKKDNDTNEKLELLDKSRKNFKRRENL